MNILLATDGSQYARGAAGFVERFPFPKDSRVTVLSVIDRHQIGGGGEPPPDEGQRSALAQTEQSVREEARGLVEAEVARLKAAGWEGSAELRVGHPAEEILEAAEEHAADLIVLGSHGHTAVRRFLIGSVSDRVLHYAGCSVLVVRQTDAAVSTRGWNLLLAFDDSAQARKAVGLCASLPLDDKAKVTALTVLPLVKLFRQDIRQRLSVFWQQKKAAARDALERVIEKTAWSTPNVSAELREGENIGHEILELAAELQSDLIVLGDKGSGAVERFLLGSVTHRVARHAPCSVWVVRL